MAKRATTLALSHRLVAALDRVAEGSFRTRSGLAEELLWRGLGEVPVASVDAAVDGPGGVRVEVAAPVLSRLFECAHRLPPTAFCVHCDSGEGAS